MWSPLLFSCSTCIHTHRHFKFQFALALFVDTIPYTVLFLSSSFLFFLLFFFSIPFSWTLEFLAGRGFATLIIPLFHFPMEKGHLHS